MLCSDCGLEQWCGYVSVPFKVHWLAFETGEAFDTKFVKENSQINSQLIRETVSHNNGAESQEEGKRTLFWGCNEAISKCRKD